MAASAPSRLNRSPRRVPCPGRSGATTRRSGPSASTCARHMVADVRRPWTRTTGVSAHPTTLRRRTPRGPDRVVRAPRGRSRQGVLRPARPRSPPSASATSSASSTASCTSTSSWTSISSSAPAPRPPASRPSARTWRRLLGRLLRLTHGGLLRAHRLEHQLDDGHRGVVTLARADLGDPGVATLALGHQRRDLGEEAVHHALVPHHGEHPAPSVQVAPLGEGDHALRERSHALGLGLGGRDPPVLEQAGRQVGEDQPLVGRTTAEPRTLGGRGHVVLLGSPPAAAGRPSNQDRSSSA